MCIRDRVGDLEVQNIKERTVAGLKRARAEGKILGTPTKHDTPENIERYNNMPPDLSLRQRAAYMGLKKTTYQNFEERRRADARGEM